MITVIYSDRTEQITEAEANKRGWFKHDPFAVFRKLAEELHEHSFKHIHNESEAKRMAAAVEGVIADRLTAAIAAAEKGNAVQWTRKK